MAARCNGRKVPLENELCTVNTGASSSALPSTKPNRPPAMDADLLRELSSMLPSQLPAHWNRLNGASLSVWL